MQLGFILSCSSLVSEASTGRPTASPTPTPQTRTDCENPETGWKLERLNGKVRSLKEEEIEYRYGSGEKELTRLVTFASNGDYLKDDQPAHFSSVDYSKIPKKTFVFDKDCRVLERHDPKRPDRLAGASRTVFSYTATGTLKEEAVYDPEGRLTWKSVATLDTNERVIERNNSIQEHPEHFRPPRYDVYRHTRSLFKFDDAGNQVEHISYNWKGELYATYKSTYDSERRLISKLRLDHKQRPIDLNLYRFDNDGVLLEEINYTSRGYSGLDELIPGTLDSGYGKFQDGYRIVYEYDKSKNWVKKSEFHLAENGKLARVTFRTLVYF